MDVRAAWIYAGLPRGEQATRERRHGGRLGLLSRGPPHDHPHAGGGEARLSVMPPGGRAAGLQRRLTDWATDPRTTIPQLHTALDEVLKNEPNPDWDISAIKYGYLELMREIERPMPLSVLQEIEGEWTFRLGDMALSPTMIESSRGGAPLPLARARTQPARPAAALCPVPGAPGNPRVAAAETGRLGQVVLPDLNEPGDEGQSQRAALPCQSGGTGRSPRAPTAGGGRLAGRNPRRQGVARAEGFIATMALATGSSWGPQGRCGPQGIP